MMSTNNFVKPKDFNNVSIKVSYPRYNFLNKSINWILKDLDNTIHDLNERVNEINPKRVK